MPDAPYDHAEKCANEGDVVKHVALIAALDVVLADWPRDVFAYADTFAGYASTVLRPGGTWARGAGRLHGDDALDRNAHAGLWRRWYLARPGLEGTAYPGSSLIAADVARRRGVSLAPVLWDIAPGALADLRAIWGRGAEIHDRPARAEDPALQAADFVFVDPPVAILGAEVRSYLAPPRRAGSLVWLPLLRDERTDAALPDHAGIDVRWGGPARTIGCRLFHRLPPPAAGALEQAVRHVAAVAGWTTSENA